MTGDRDGDDRGRGRSAQIDFLRAAAIVAVVIIHVWGPSTEVTPERSPLQAAFFAFFVSGSSWAVPCFFFLSGLLLTQRAEFPTWADRLAWLRRRGARLLPPYLFWSLLCLLAAGRAQPLTILRSLATGAASYQMYFVVALVQAYALWWLVMPWLSGQKPHRQRLVLLGCVGVSLSAHVWRWGYLDTAEVDRFEWLRATVLPWIGYFAFGCLLTLRSGAKGAPAALQCMIDRRPQARRFQTLLFALLAFAVLVLMATGEATYRGPMRDDPLNTVLKPLYAFPMLLVVVALSEWCEARAGPRARRFAAALARDSYGIYLAHVLVMRLLESHVYLQLAGLSLPMELAYRAFGLIVTVGVSWGIVRLLSLLPGIRWVSGADMA